MHPYLTIALPLGPISIQQLVSRIPSDRYDTVFEEDRFSVREVVAHLADWEPLFRARMELAYAAPGSAIVTYDEGERAVELRYCDCDLAEQLEQYAAERAKTVAFLKGLAPAEFRLTYLHPRLKEMAIEDQANMLVGHDLYHVQQLLGYLDALT